MDRLLPLIFIVAMPNEWLQIDVSSLACLSSSLFCSYCLTRMLGSFVPTIFSLEFVREYVDFEPKSAPVKRGCLSGIAEAKAAGK